MLDHTSSSMFRFFFCHHQGDIIQWIIQDFFGYLVISALESLHFNSRMVAQSEPKCIRGTTSVIEHKKVYYFCWS